MGGKWGCMCDEGFSQVCRQRGFMLGAWAVVEEVLVNRGALCLGRAWTKPAIKIRDLKGNWTEWNSLQCLDQSQTNF